MATVAVFVALGGTSYAVATGSIDSREIKNNTVRSKDIRNGTIGTRDVNDGALLADDFKAGQLPGGPTGAQGPKGDPGDPGTARAFVHVIDGPAVNATVDVANSKGVTAANMTHTETGAFYCFHDLGFTPQSVIASSDLLGGPADEVQVALGNQGGCSPTPEQLTVRTADNDANQDGGFWLLIN
jgi:hypothetical protein